MSFQLYNALQMFTELPTLSETEGGSTQEILNIREKCQTSAAPNWFFLPCILTFRGIIALMSALIYNFRTAANTNHHIEKYSKQMCKWRKE